jgi:hypothetical protein
MKPLIQFKQTPIFLTTLALFYCGIVSVAQAVVPPPDGGYPNFTTAEGQNALFNLTTGVANTANGWFSLFSNTGGSYNTGVGAGTLALNTADNNTAVGAAALLLNTTGVSNTGIGSTALLQNTTGSSNNALGDSALTSNTMGSINSAVGDLALTSNTTGNWNTAMGAQALRNNTIGALNTASGFQALTNNTAGGFNTANGPGALFGNTTGSNNIALGAGAGDHLTTGDNNIDIGNGGTAGESNTIRIGNATQDATYIAGIAGVVLETGSPVVIDSATGQLGIQPMSSARFRGDIKPIEQASEILFALKPVSFRYKKEIDSAGSSQFGLVAEDVEKVNADLVVRDKEGKPYGVRYDQVNAMLLNEFLKEHRKNEEQQTTIKCLQQQVDAITARLEEVSARLDQGNAVPKIVLNSQ